MTTTVANALSDTHLTLTPRPAARWRSCSPRSTSPCRVSAVYAVPGACSGISFGMTFTDQLNGNDSSRLFDTFKVIVDDGTLEYIRASRSTSSTAATATPASCSTTCRPSAAVAAAAAAARAAAAAADRFGTRSLATRPAGRAFSGLRCPEEPRGTILYHPAWREAAPGWATRRNGMIRVGSSAGRATRASSCCGCWPAPRGGDRRDHLPGEAGVAVADLFRACATGSTCASRADLGRLAECDAVFFATPNGTP